VLLEGGERVYAIDVGHGQLTPAGGGPRVVSREGVNARDLSFADIGEASELSFADVSFISLRWCCRRRCAWRARALGVFLVKPQFEVGRDAVGKGGHRPRRRLAEGAASDIARWLDATSGGRSWADPFALAGATATANSDRRRRG
jgi:23S rRNA (cytidine1920-2'-O)/16S rRNA (cytidine1409-2'-O)-methyltransferase